MRDLLLRLQEISLDEDVTPGRVVREYLVRPWSETSRHSSMPGTEIILRARMLLPVTVRSLSHQMDSLWGSALKIEKVVRDLSATVRFYQTDGIRIGKEADLSIEDSDAGEKRMQISVVVSDLVSTEEVRRALRLAGIPVARDGDSWVTTPA
jgi:hypothetical protein